MRTIAMSPWLLATAAVVPLAIGLAVAWPLWRRRLRDEIGSISGAAVVLVWTIGLIAHEFGDVLEITRRCVETETPCRFRPDPFTRYAIFGGIGFVQMFVLFVIGLVVDEHLRRRGRRGL
jgi:hypothetical protein